MSDPDATPRTRKQRSVLADISNIQHLASSNLTATCEDSSSKPMTRNQQKTAKPTAVPPSFLEATVKEKEKPLKKSQVIVLEVQRVEVTAKGRMVEKGYVCFCRMTLKASPSLRVIRRDLPLLLLRVKVYLKCRRPARRSMRGHALRSRFNAHHSFFFSLVYAVFVVFLLAAYRSHESSRSDWTG